MSESKAYRISLYKEGARFPVKTSSWFFNKDDIPEQRQLVLKDVTDEGFELRIEESEVARFRIGWWNKRVRASQEQVFFIPVKDTSALVYASVKWYLGHEDFKINRSTRM
jgi:hypothetical protein